MELTFNWTMAAMVSVPALLCWLAFALWAKQPATEYIYYDPDEVFPPAPQAWGIDDYQPWSGLYDNPEEEIEAVTALWNEATNEGDTVLASVLFDEYERLCREYR